VERRALRRVVTALIALVLLAGVIVTRGAWRHRGRTRPRPPDVNAPAETRVRVQVLNATTTRGLARRAAMHLRDRGFDVVEMGTTTELRDTTLVLDRSGHAGLAKRVADALGGARVESRPDSSRYLDVTVLLGRSWRPPAEPLYP